MKFLFKLILILIVGAFGGVLGTRLLLPYLASKPYFERFQFIKQSAGGTTIINKQEQVVIKENDAFEKAVNKVSPLVVGIRSQKGGKTVFEGSGIVMTADGLILTLNPSLALSGQQYYVFYNGDKVLAEAQEKDMETNLALLKVEATNLPVTTFGPEEMPVWGESVVLIGADITETGLKKFINSGIVSALEEENFEVNIREDNKSFIGGPLINAEGEVIGINNIDKAGKIVVLPVKQIKEFLNKAF